MSDTVIGRAGETFSESARTASRLASSFAEACEEGIGAAKKVMKHGGDAAEEFFDDTTKRLARHPVETVIVALAAGVSIGIVIGWLIKRS